MSSTRIGSDYASNNSFDEFSDTAKKSSDKSVDTTSNSLKNSIDPSVKSINGVVEPVLKRVVKEDLGSSHFKPSVEKLIDDGLGTSNKVMTRLTTASVDESTDQLKQRSHQSVDAISSKETQIKEVKKETKNEKTSTAAAGIFDHFKKSNIETKDVLPVLKARIVVAMILSFSIILFTKIASIVCTHTGMPLLSNRVALPPLATDLTTLAVVNLGVPLVSVIIQRGMSHDSEPTNDKHTEKQDAKPENLQQSSLTSTKSDEESIDDTEKKSKEVFQQVVEHGTSIAKPVVGGAAKVALTVSNPVTPFLMPVLSPSVDVLVDKGGDLIKSTTLSIGNFTSEKTSQALKSKIRQEVTTTQVENKKPEFETKHFLDRKLVVTPKKWGVSAARDLNAKNPYHVFLIIQGMDEKGRDELYRVHLVIDEKSEKKKWVSGSLNKTEIKINDFSDEVVNNPDKVSVKFQNCEHITKEISPEQGKQLIALAKEDQGKDIYYSILDNKVMNFSGDIGVSTQIKNCGSYAEWLLKRLGIDLINSGWFVGLFVIHPKVLIPGTSLKNKYE